MKKYFFLVVFFTSLIGFAQTDYSDSWEDFYSYNNVKDFIKIENSIYALADNAVFIYDLNTQEIQKFSSIQGLSGGVTTSIHFNTTFKRLVIGYEDGLIEVVDEDNSITISPDIVNFNQSNEKSINHISEFGNKLYLSTPFGIVVYDIENLEFGDTYFIGNNSSAVNIHQTVIANNQIYAATETGIFIADIRSSFLIDFNNWEQHFSGRNFSQILTFNNEVITSENKKIYQLLNASLTEKKNFSQNIVALKASEIRLSVSFNNSATILDSFYNNVFQSAANTEFNYTLNNTLFDNNTLFLATKEFGILSTVDNLALSYTEIHPEGPTSNDVFSITAENNDLWVVYGGYSISYTPLNRRQGYSHFNGENWINTRFNSNLPNDLADVTIDPNNKNKVYISALGISNDINTKPTGGLLVIENDELIQTYNHLNSAFEPIQVSLPSINIRVSSSAFDDQGNLWATNYETLEELIKFSASGQSSPINLSSIKNNGTAGTNEVVVDKNNSIWIGTRGNGALIYNENGDRKKALITNVNEGNLPDLNVRTIAVDDSNRVWLGTKSGLVVYANAAGVFDENLTNAEPVIILDDGIAKKLLGDQTINSIVVDGAQNKWFGTDNGGVLYTNPSGQTTLANFSNENSPLPSNRIIKISVDDSTGKVYFATDKGIVAYNSNVSPFGNILGEVYAFPNPALKQHEFVTIDGRNGTHLPKGTNVKILDVAGNLVHETNVLEGQELQGGKVIWDKTNLAGNKVASGIYIVLLSNDDASETSTTKIAIVN